MGKKYFMTFYRARKTYTTKHGAMQVAAGFTPKFRSSRERVVVVRGVERCLVEYCLVWSTARLLETCAPPETKRDFVFHLKALLEHAPARDRLPVISQISDENEKT